MSSHPVRKTVEDESETVSLVEFVVELDPVQSQSVQEAFHTVHAEKHAEGDVGQHHEANQLLCYGFVTAGIPEKPETMPP